MVQKPGPQEVWVRSDTMNSEVPRQNHQGLDGCEVDQWISPLKCL